MKVLLDFDGVIVHTIELVDRILSEKIPNVIIDTSQWQFPLRYPDIPNEYIYDAWREAYESNEIFRYIDWGFKHLLETPELNTYVVTYLTEGMDIQSKYKIMKQLLGDNMKKTIMTFNSKEILFSSFDVIIDDSPLLAESYIIKKPKDTIFILYQQDWNRYLWNEPYLITTDDLIDAYYIIGDIL